MYKMISENSNKIYNIHTMRLNHLTNILDQFDNIDDSGISIPLKYLKQEITKRNIQKSDLAVSRIRNMLKKYNFKKYCEYAPLIFCHLVEIKPLKIKYQDKNEIIKVFDEIVQSYEYCCLPGRASFLNYDYVLQKICKMLGMNEYLIFFSLPDSYKKNQEKMLNNESVWNKLCEYNYDNWKYYLGYEIIE
jgi:hypothetical protein